MEDTKRCTKCGEVKQLSEYSFRKRDNKYQSICKVCNNKMVKEWVKSHEIEKKNGQARYRETHKKEITEYEKMYGRKYYKIHKEKRLIYAKQYRQKHNDALNAREFYYYAGLKSKDIPEEAIELRMKYLALKRRLKELKEAENGKGKDGSGTGGNHVRTVGQAPKAGRVGRGAQNG